MARTKKEKPEIKVGNFVKGATVVHMIWKNRKDALKIGYIDNTFTEYGLYVPVRVTKVEKVTPSGVVKVEGAGSYWRICKNFGDRADNIGYSSNKKNGNSMDSVMVVDSSKISEFEAEIARWNALRDAQENKEQEIFNGKVVEEYNKAIEFFNKGEAFGLFDTKNVIVNGKLSGAVVRTIKFPSAIFLVTTIFGTSEFSDGKSYITGTANITGHIFKDSGYIENRNLDIRIDYFKHLEWLKAGIIDSVEVEKYLLGQAYYEINERVSNAW